VKVVRLHREEITDEYGLQKVTYTFVRHNLFGSKTFDLDNNFLEDFQQLPIPVRYYKVSNLGILHTFVHGMGKKLPSHKPRIKKKGNINTGNSP